MASGLGCTPFQGRETRPSWTISFISRPVQHWWQQPTCHLDRHGHPFPGVGHSGQRGLVCKEGKHGEVRGLWPGGALVSKAQRSPAPPFPSRGQAPIASAWQMLGLAHSASLLPEPPRSQRTMARTQLSPPFLTPWTSFWRSSPTLMALPSPTARYRPSPILGESRVACWPLSPTSYSPLSSIPRS